MAEGFFKEQFGGIKEITPSALMCIVWGGKKKSWQNTKKLNL